MFNHLNPVEDHFLLGRHERGGIEIEITEVYDRLESETNARNMLNAIFAFAPDLSVGDTRDSYDMGITIRFTRTK